MRVVGLVLITTLLLLEGVARLAGLGSTLLYEKTEYGYRVAPNQSITRLGRTTTYNDLGLRNHSTPALPSENTLRILCIGDSITFGGTLTDQRQTFPHQLQALLSNAHHALKVEVLNASAGGWATENEEGWLNANGVFGAQWVVLQVATHDLFQEKSGSAIVGSHPSFPDRQPWFALHEAVTRYVLPLLGRWSRDPGADLYYRSASDVSRALGSIERINATVRRSRAQLVVLFVEQPKSVEPSDALTLWAKQQLFTRLSNLGVPVIRPANSIELAGGVGLFRDGLHPTAEGNRVLAHSIETFLNTSIASAAR